MQGKAYPQPNKSVSLSAIDPLLVSTYSEGQIEPLFRRCTSLGIDTLINQGGPPQIDVAARTIRNDQFWKGFFPKDNILNVMSSALFTGFKKEFHKDASGHYTGITSDTDDHIQARNSLEEINLAKPTGTLEAGKYILLEVSGRALDGVLRHLQGDQPGPPDRPRLPGRISERDSPVYVSHDAQT